MKNMPGNMRSVEVYAKGVWASGEWASLKEGMIFRLREPDGSIVDGGRANEICVALGDAEPEPAPMLFSIQCEPFTVATTDHPMAPRI